VIIEVKLAANAEARRAVVAQLLSYASYLRGLTTSEFDRLLTPHLSRVGHAAAADAVQASGVTGTFDGDDFDAVLAEHLARGSFRLVLALDSAPPDLIQLVGYLEAISLDSVSIDIITVSSYNVGDTRILVPQRIDPERTPETLTAAPMSRQSAVTVEGAVDFVEGIDGAEPEHRSGLRQLADWAIELERQGTARLFSTRGTSGRMTLQARVTGDSASLVSIWNDRGAFITLARSVFVRLVPEALEGVEELVGAVGQNSSVKAPLPDGLFDLLTCAYSSAASKKLPA